ncbi:predicted protein [Micromonas commoda]|uniref:NADH dehydrogenase [ubiquinone] 1 beta subcomplex subunit 2 n=1 Tax=Micromonas commoda (strain RCC299 / NOUM17 / CCMP2709) TaxID=296587 RepID=C1E4X4_MICCC|nr:predicted protein [Micromonas commoda]ACO63198.1 predicted protein [Micromonas commoda]|eukprot:XP_002501940.1 predicted protein [Micromonas commoda]
MAARSAMGFAAGALRQTVARQTAPQFAPRPLARQTRAMGGGGNGVTHEGLTLHEPGAFHKFWAYGLGGLTWFWVFYRFYKDGDTLIYGHAPHFEHDDHDDHH